MSDNSAVIAELVKEMREMRQEIRELREEMKRRDERHEFRLGMMANALRAGSPVQVPDEPAEGRPETEGVKNETIEGQEAEARPQEQAVEGNEASEGHQEQGNVPVEGANDEANRVRNVAVFPLAPMDRHTEHIRQSQQHLRPGQEVTMTLRTYPDRIIRRRIDNDRMSELVSAYYSDEVEIPRSGTGEMTASRHAPGPLRPMRGHGRGGGRGGRGYGGRGRGGRGTGYRAQPYP